MKVSLSTSIALYLAAAGCTTLLACANHSKETPTALLPVSRISMPQTSTYIAPQVGQMPDDGDNILRDKMYNMFLSSLSN
jgi:hypothetical protein